jgi:transposase
MAKSAYSAKEKYELIVAYENRQTSARHFFRQYNISKGTINKWIYLFQTYGMEGLQGSNGKKSLEKFLNSLFY